ncbi:MAG: bifunctional 4-hydroxy-2-oxoglutarate aldolase/2-dehydro-3-deoxy-phosphogluconate aldolase [Chloroflexi bacterium]|nr:bifunctional 4-hydroxy-2-oxoglutarate aldolase/2-dehydro-3-deoxy-phosphogluconate aldolase [Chloroflexota bacterium]
MHDMSRREEAVYLTKSTGILPAMKLKQPTDMLPYAQAMYDGGARVIEITMTTPGVLENFRAISAAFGDKLYLAAGTCLDAASALDAIKAGARILVSPAVVPEVIDIANRYRVACYSGAFTATEVFTVMRAGADMVKIFPAALGGPSYMTNLKMVYPEVNLIPSGGISLETAGEFIRAGACAVSGMRNFFDAEQVAQHGVGWITTQTQRYLQLVANAKKANISLP